MRHTMYPALVAPLFALVSCASIMTPSSTETKIVSADPITFRTSTGLTATTPAKVNVPTGSAVTILWTNPDGSDGVMVSAPNRLSLWVLGDVFLGVGGFVVDALRTSNRMHPKTIELPVVYPETAPLSSRTESKEPPKAVVEQPSR